MKQLIKKLKVTIGTETKIGNLVILTGSKPSDIIENYNSIKRNVEQVGGTKNPDIPSSSGNSGSGGNDTTAPIAVTGVIGSSLDTNPLTLGGIQNIISWTANTASDLSYYEVFRSTNPNGTTGATKVSSNVAKGVITFNDTSVVAGTRYYYTVYAVDTSGNRSASSNVVMVATFNDILVSIPSEPTGLQGVSPTMAGNDGKITGIEEKLLKFAEKELKKKGAKVLYTNMFLETNPNVKFSLRKQLWTPPVLDKTHFIINVKDMHKEKWIETNHFPEDFTVKEWNQINENELESLRNADWYPKHLSPFESYHFGEISLKTSFWAFYKDEIIGWIAGNIVNNETLFITSLFFKDDKRNHYILRPLLGEVIKNQIKINIPYACFDVRNKDEKY